MTIQELLNHESIDKTRIPEWDEESNRICEHIFDLKPHELILNKHKTVSEKEEKEFLSIVNKRMDGIPLAYILGYTYFYGEKFPVSEETLIPRYDTEHLVEAVRKYAQDSQNIIDICTGTGVIALSLHKIFPQKKILGLDIVQKPFEASRSYLNISSDKVLFQKMDFLNRSLWESLGSWDCIVSNPPYLDTHDMNVLDNHVKLFEPHTALFGGDNGLIFYESIRDFANKYLRPKGIIVLEIDHKYQEVIDLFPKEIYPEHILINDFTNLPRVLIIKKS